MRRLAGVLILAVGLAACAGPDPRVLSVRADDVRDGATIVTVELENRGSDGSVEIRVTVRDDSGNVVGRDTENVDLEGHEKVRVAIEVPVAQGVAHVTAEARAIYPPE